MFEVANYHVKYLFAPDTLWLSCCFNFRDWGHAKSTLIGRELPSNHQSHMNQDTISDMSCQARTSLCCSLMYIDRCLYCVFSFLFCPEMTLAWYSEILMVKFVVNSFSVGQTINGTCPTNLSCTDCGIDEDDWLQIRTGVLCSLFSPARMLDYE